MTTLLDLVQVPEIEDIAVEEYDFDAQIRFATLPTMNFTMGSIATFDYAGKPKDSQNDNND
jgi:hypothetical protein